MAGSTSKTEKAPAVNLSVGKMVKYVLAKGESRSNDKVRPMMITFVGSGEVLNGLVFLDGDNDTPQGATFPVRWVTSVPRDDKSEKSETWHL